MQLKMSLSSHSLQIPTLVLKPSSNSRNPKFLRILQQRSTSRSSTPLPQHMQDSHKHYYKFSRKTFQCMSQIGKQKQQQQEYQVERLFSNLNQATLKREPGSLSSAIFLVAGTTVGAGILVIPSVTQESGFLASAVACIVCWIFMVSMAKRTLGTVGAQISCWSYIFIHYALLVAYVARSSDILTNFLGIPLWESATLFSLVFGGICYFGR